MPRRCYVARPPLRHDRPATAFSADSLVVARERAASTNGLSGGGVGISEALLETAVDAMPAPRAAQVGRRRRRARAPHPAAARRSQVHGRACVTWAWDVRGLCACVCWGRCPESGTAVADHQMRKCQCPDHTHSGCQWQPECADAKCSERKVARVCNSVWQPPMRTTRLAPLLRERSRISSKR